jgi:DNA-directed RNA polymerase sigma subunit (sigma70/sigma32)
LSQVVILRHYGEDGPPMKLREIGERLGISDERVRQLLRRAYAQLAPLCREMFHHNKD